MLQPRALVSGFLGSVGRFPDRPAIQIKHEYLSYSELYDQARRVAAAIQAFEGSSNNLTGVFGHRSFAAFAGVLGGLLCGGPYVPLNPSFPEDRTLNMIRRARLDKFVVELESLPRFLPILGQIEQSVLVLLPDAEQALEIPMECSHHSFVAGPDFPMPERFVHTETDPEELAYLLFTSGSTGQPKGVMVKQSNVTHFVDCMTQRYSINEQDRFSQTFDLTFDLSAFDMFVAWEKGACLCVPTQGEKMLPAKYIQSQNITIWFSVPSTAIMMKKLRMLKPAAFPSIRCSLFCGEALPLEVTEEFQQAAPGSVLENLYGPTELTIACTLYRYDTVATADEAEQGVVPIGVAYPGMQLIIVDDELNEVAEGEAGELLMAGPQLTAGYWEDELKTANAYVVPPGRDQTFYRTGDRVRRKRPEGPLLYLGRVDNQIKVQGYRVELGEIEARLRDAAGVDVAIAAGHPIGASGAEGIVAFMSPSEREQADIMNALSGQLPAYMQPNALVIVDEFPLNANGKVDRKALMDDHLPRN